MQSLNTSDWLFSMFGDALYSVKITFKLRFTYSRKCMQCKTLEGYCDFPSNKNVLTIFYEFFVGILNFVGLFLS